MPQLNPDTSWWAGYSSLQRFEEQWPAYTRGANSVTYCQVSVLQSKGIYHPVHQKPDPDFCLFVRFFVNIYKIKYLIFFFPLSN